MFSDAGPDVRWCGNETGSAGDPNWSTMNPAAVPFPGADGPGIIAALQHGDPNGTVWRPAEVDVSIRPGWFHHPAQDERVRTVDNLLDLYCTSVGRNGKLLLNVPPTRAGLLHATDVARLDALRTRRDEFFASDAVADIQDWKSTGPRSATLTLTLRRPIAVSALRLGEDVPTGQVVAKYTVSGLGASGWNTLSTGATIGYAKIDRFASATVSQARVAIDAVDTPGRVALALFNSA